MSSGDTVSVAGTARLSSWEKDGVSHTGLNVTATGILTAYEIRKRRGDGDDRKPEKPANATENRGTTQPVGADFDDEIPF